MAKILNFPVEINVSPVFTENEINALTLAKNIVIDLTEIKGELISQDTGEVIDTKELYRVAGILDGLLTTAKWTLR